MNYCSACGHQLVHEIPELDNRERGICKHCGTIHYENPKVIVGSLPVFCDQVLLCKRAIEPRWGFWTLPAGFLENHESTTVGAARETLEEAGATYTDAQLYRVYDIPHISQVYVFYLAQLVEPVFHPGVESLDVRLFKEDEIPWKALAFPVMKTILTDYFEDRTAGIFPAKSSVIDVSLR